jgi:uncharacterized protein YjbI with pentapeptide repeats
MKDQLKSEETTWKSVKRDGYRVMAPAEFAGRRLLFFYQSDAWARVALALIGGLAVLSTILSLSQWSHDRKIQKLNLFVQIKEGANGAPVAALLKSLISGGIAVEQIPLANSKLSGADLSNTYMPKAFFKNTDLKESNCKNADLFAAQFDGSYINAGEFSNARLDEAQFVNAKVAYINLSMSRLDEASFSFMFQANLESASARKAQFMRGYLLMPISKE